MFIVSQKGRISIYMAGGKPINMPQHGAIHIKRRETTIYLK